MFDSKGAVGRSLRLFIGYCDSLFATFNFQVLLRRRGMIAAARMGSSGASHSWSLGRYRSMQFCEQCGSTSRDKDGFCGGCGAGRPAIALQGRVQVSGPDQASPYDGLPAKIASIGIPEIRPKPVWVAVLLALVLGPLGLLYSTTAGTMIMLIVAIVLRLFFGNISLLVVLPICAFWAWRATRDSSSILD
jgi:hypothetical protein